MHLDENVVTAIQHYFTYGLPPGSFTTSLLTGEYSLAMLQAHPLIKEYVDDHVLFVEKYIPLCCRGEYFKEWRGYADAIKKDPALRHVLHLSLPERSPLREWMAASEIDNSVQDALAKQRKENVLP